MRNGRPRAFSQMADGLIPGPSLLALVHGAGLEDAYAGLRPTRLDYQAVGATPYHCEQRRDLRTSSEILW